MRPGTDFAYHWGVGHRPVPLMKVYKGYSNIYPTRCNVTQFILSGNCSTCFGWYHHPSSGAETTISIAADSSNGMRNIRCCRYSFSAPDDEWWYHPKHVEQFPDKINCVTLHLVGYILEYSYDARTHER